MVVQELSSLRERIQNVCTRTGRDHKEIELVLVTKEVDLEKIKEAYQLGCRDFGENRVQDLVKKQKVLPEDIRWHFIGHVQTNKVKVLAGNIALIHSCDRLDLAKEIQRQAEKRNQTVELLIQVNTSGEKTKQGFYPKNAEEAVSEIAMLNRLKIRGLMTIGPNAQDLNEIRRSFRSLRVLRDELRDQFPRADWHYLSMGMSSDFEIAIEEGANLLRIGTAVFGPRS